MLFGVLCIDIVVYCVVKYIVSGLQFIVQGVGQYGDQFDFVVELFGYGWVGDFVICFDQS